MSFAATQAKILYDRLIEEKGTIEKRIEILEEFLSTFPTDTASGSSGRTMTVAIEAAQQFLSHRSAATTMEIYEHLLAHGIIINGKNPINNLAAYLSYNERFISNRSKGWTLKQEDYSQKTREEDLCLTG